MINRLENKEVEGDGWVQRGKDNEGCGQNGMEWDTGREAERLLTGSGEDDCN